MIILPRGKELPKLDDSAGHDDADRHHANYSAKQSIAYSDLSQASKRWSKQGLATHGSHKRIITLAFTERKEGMLSCKRTYILTKEGTGACSSQTIRLRFCQMPSRERLSSFGRISYTIESSFGFEIHLVTWLDPVISGAKFVFFWIHLRANLVLSIIEMTFDCFWISSYKTTPQRAVIVPTISN